MLGARALSATEVKERATACGFDLCGIAAPAEFAELRFLREWIARGYHGDMQYMARTAERRADVRAVLPSARSVIVLTTVYNTAQPYSTSAREPSRAAIARYAWGDDYHAVIEGRMQRLVEMQRWQAVNNRSSSAALRFGFRSAS